MAVTKVIEKWQGRGASTDEKGVRTLQREWDVTTDSDDTAEPAVIDAVIAADASAALYASHPAWAPALCRKLDTQPNNGPRAWKVKAEYSTAPFEARGDGSGAGANSTSPNSNQNNEATADSRPPTISITRKEVTEPLEFDAETLDPVVNTVGDPFEPVPEVMRSRQLITWKFHRTPAQLDWNNRSQWMDTVNFDAVTILGRTYPARSLRCVDYSLGTVWDTGPTGLAFFFELTAQAEYKPDLWDVSLLNTGRRKKVGTGGTGDPVRLVAIVDDQGQPVADPVPLDAAGVPVAPGGAKHYVDFSGYLLYPWNGTGGVLTGAGGLLA
jgi:hypothetical protein